jgi:hypothetical protein
MSGELITGKTLRPVTFVDSLDNSNCEGILPTGGLTFELPKGVTNHTDTNGWYIVVLPYRLRRF